MEIKNKIIKQSLVNWQNLKVIQQDNFKELSKESYNKLKQSIINNNFVQPLNVWESGKEIFCLDGFHRIKVLQKLQEEGYSVPKELPANFVECKDKKEASKLVLVYSSIYAKITDEGLYEFLNMNELDFEDVKLELELPELDLGKFQKGYVEESIQDELSDKVCSECGRPL